MTTDHATDDGPDLAGRAPATEPVPTSPPPGAAALVVAHDVDHQLDRRIVTVWRLGAIIGLVIPIAAMMLLALLLPLPGWIIVLPTTILVGATIGPWQMTRWRRWSWRLSGEALELRSGVLIRRHVTLPHFRVQQIDVLEGPLERLFGLATLTVTTASAGGSASLPGLRVEDAPVVRRELLALAALANARLGDGGRDAV